ncbi:metallophosphoesterase family protein [Paenibacillus sp. PL91]|uniref:metallophosphoesterase family protein n=1 Tax=Paenibacillus sp. PL91 TaxID=2729538 RepID=UPI00145EB550|nr:metallophosphoesterase [Paenibacillus sp. PL91]MBC9200233.1 metallophosphoesterase [Paenibacillus sp. PL91]
MQSPIISFQVITDTHVTTERDHIYNRHLEQALLDIAAHSTNSIGIMHVGDVTDHGLRAEYAEFVRIWEACKAGLPDMQFTFGNHDLFLGDWSSQLKLYESYTGMNGAYYDKWLQGYHFIFLGSEQGGLKDFAYLTEEQLAWLDRKLGEDASSSKPVFVFLHQPLKDTVAGSLEGQGWHGVIQDEELKAILAKHPQTIMFNGHTHWELEAGHACFEGKGITATLFNAASVAYLWTNADEYKEGSQGYYVDVYEDKVIVRGRDFVTSSWIDKERYEVKLQK